MRYNDNGSRTTAAQEDNVSRVYHTFPENKEPVPLLFIVYVRVRACIIGIIVIIIIIIIVVVTR